MQNYNQYTVVHITSEILNNTYGGVGTVLNLIYENRSGNEVFIYIPWESGKKDILHNKIGDAIYEYSRKSILAIESLPFKNVEKIFIHTPEVLCLPNLITKAKKIKVVHGIIPLENVKNFRTDPYSDSMFWNSYKNAHEVITVSYSEAVNLIKLVRLNKLKEKRISYIYNGIDFENNKNVTLSDSKKIGFIGRFDLRKGLLPIVEQMLLIPDYQL